MFNTLKMGKMVNSTTLKGDFTGWAEAACSGQAGRTGEPPAPVPRPHGSAPHEARQGVQVTDREAPEAFPTHLRGH